jgi:hypothetical protein
MSSLPKPDPLTGDHIPEASRPNQAGFHAPFVAHGVPPRRPLDRVPPVDEARPGEGRIARPAVSII